MKIKLIPIHSPVGKCWWFTEDKRKFKALENLGFRIERAAKEGFTVKNGLVLKQTRDRAIASIQSGAVARAIEAGIVENIWENGQFHEN